MVTEGDRTLWQVTKGDGTLRHRSDLVLYRGVAKPSQIVNWGAETCAKR